ncbi:MAG: hypothetical protein Q8N33_00415 [Rhodocyclaceae bacterium]|nr:hypothetical protein [Rhodocyclaceae bacterium]
MKSNQNSDAVDIDQPVGVWADGIEAAESIIIEVPTNYRLPGYQWGEPSQWTEDSLRSYVLIPMYRFMDDERFEEAADAARRDPDDVLAAALILKKQAEACKAARAAWIDPTPDMINAGAREAEEKRLAHSEIIRSKHASDKKRAECAANALRIYELVAPKFAEAERHLAKEGRKRQGAKLVAARARENAIRQSGGDPKKLREMPERLTAATIRASGGDTEKAPGGYEYLTMTRAERYLESRKSAEIQENTVLSR